MKESEKETNSYIKRIKLHSAATRSRKDAKLAQILLFVLSYCGRIIRRFVTWNGMGGLRPKDGSVMQCCCSFSAL